VNRNAAIGVVLVGVLLAALSVGIATYMSKGTIEESAQAMRDEVAATSEQLGSQIDDVAENALPKKNGEAQALASVDTLWSKGRLTVTDSSGAGTPLFEVDPAASRVVIDADAIEFGDVDAGALVSTGDVVGAGFATKGGAWAVDDSGNQRSDGDLTVGGNLETGGILKVNGGELRVGDGFVYEAGAKKLSVVGTIVASTFDSGNLATEYVSDVIFHKSVAAKSGAWRLEQDGAARFGATKVASLISGVVSASDITATGGVTAAGDVTGRDVIAIRTLKTDGDRFVVDAATGNTAVGGTLTVNGDASAANLTTAGSVNAATLTTSGNGSLGGALTVTGAASAASFTSTGAVSAATLAASGNTTVGGTLGITGDVTAAGNVDVASLSFSGVPFEGDVGTNPNKDVVGRDLVAHRGFETDGGTFTVDTATGDTYVGGTLDVAGAITAASLTASGNISAAAITTTGNVTVGGNITAANLPGMLFGTVVAAPGPNPVSAPGMPAGATVFVTPQASTNGQYYVDSIAADGFVLTTSDAGPVTFSWVAVW